MSKEFRIFLGIVVGIFLREYLICMFKNVLNIKGCYIVRNKLFM